MKNAPVGSFRGWQVNLEDLFPELLRSTLRGAALEVNSTATEGQETGFSSMLQGGSVVVTRRQPFASPLCAARKTARRAQFGCCGRLEQSGVLRNRCEPNVPLREVSEIDGSALGVTFRPMQ